VAGYYSTTRPLVLHAIERQKNLFGNLVPFPFYSILSKLTKIYIYFFLVILMSQFVEMLQNKPPAILVKKFIE
jgi:hypothetical protein